MTSDSKITETQFNQGGSHEIKLGERCVLWVRNAHIDKKFFFERYYQGKYVGRSSQLEIDAAHLGPGEHLIEPGAHIFTLSPENKLASTDPDILIDGNTLCLKLHKVTVMGVDAAKAGPAEFRLVPADVGMLSLDANYKLDLAKLPNVAATFDPQQPPAPDQPVPPLMNVLSNQAEFYPLSVWLPANEVGQGYLLYPSWQTFHLTREGTVNLDAPQGPKVPGIEATASTIVIPYRQFSGLVNSRTQLTAGVGHVTLGLKMRFGATLAPTKFVASHEKPPEDFFLSIDNDFTRLPHKYFVADNTAGDKDAIRMMVLEWGTPVFTRAGEAVVQLRLLESAGKQTLKDSQVVMRYSFYTPSNPLARDWKPLEVLSWKNGRDAGELRFRVPDLEFSYIVLQTQIVEAGDASHRTPLTGEISGCVIDRDQTGTASVISVRGRNAFVAGEVIDLQLVLRSKDERPKGERVAMLTHPDGHEESLPFTDTGRPWLAQGVQLTAARTIDLPPGVYRLTVRDLPPGIVSVPFIFDLVGRQKSSLYHIVKPSKYTGPMNELEPSHLLGKPIDLDRAMRTLADLGYTRVDLMSYMTNHHLQAYTWREDLSVADDRLPPPESVYTPTPREQILNACVRNQLQYSDVWLSYGDFHLPRQIEGYIRASERWIAREMQSMRYSPALDGMMLYDEMYQTAAVGLVEGHAKLFPAIRARLAEKELGATPAKIEQAFNRYLERPRDQREPKALETYLKYQDFQQHGWADYVNRMVNVGKRLMPTARFGTYYRTWMMPGANDDIYHGYPPDLFKNLDVISHVHYADNATSWVHTCMMAKILRTGKDKTLYVNMPLSHESRTEWDGQYQRHMALALMSQGANGVSQWGLNHTFEDGPNPGTAIARDTTAHMNHDILRRFGELIDRTRDGYRKVGIVSTLNQHALSQFKQLPVANQTEGIWTACWRLGYPAEFVRQDTADLDQFAVLFVPGVRFDGELQEAMVKRLKDAIAAGVKVVVEADSTLELPGITRLADWQLNSYFVGTYFPTWSDDELNKVYEKSQPIVDYLRPKLKEWKVEPSAVGNFKVGPNWRDGGAAQYLIMANFEDPDYTHTVRQQMAKPVLMPLSVAEHRGKIAYDLLAQKGIEVTGADGERSITLDMRRIQGALVAFLPERIGKLAVKYAMAEHPGRLRLSAQLISDSARPLDAVFPTTITLVEGQTTRTFERVLGRDLTVELDLPRAFQARSYQVEVRESLSGKTARFLIEEPAAKNATLVLTPIDAPYVPYPQEVTAFLADAKKQKRVAIVPARTLSGSDKLAEELVARLKKIGVTAYVADENRIYRQPTGDPKAEDPLNDGFHSWHGGQEIIGPAVVIDEPVILLSAAHGSFLLDQLANHGYLTLPTLGTTGLQARPTIQVAAKGFHYEHDTLCLIANDPVAMARNVEKLFQQPSKTEATSAATFGKDLTAESADPTEATPAVAFMGTNELVKDIQFDASGNLYAITWGHGKNLYSIAPDGKPRFSRMLPEMGANKLRVYADRLYAHTAAGARLYHLSLDNHPVAQARLNMDPGSITGCDNYSLAEIDFAWFPDRHVLLHNMGDRMRVLDEQFNIVNEWAGEAYADKDVSDKIMRRRTHAFVVSPDGQRIAQLETSSYFTKWDYKDQEVFDTHLVIRDPQGKLLAEYKNLDNGTKVEAQLTWPADAPGPVVYAPNSTLELKHERWAFDADLKLLEARPFDIGMFQLGGARRLVRDGRSLVYCDTPNHEQCRLGPLEIMPTVAEIRPDQQFIALLDEQGLLSLFQTKDGALHKQFKLSEHAQVIRFTPDSQRLVLGGCRGNVFYYQLNGQLAWQVTLGDLNDVLGSDLPLYDASFPDFTPKLWPVSRDEPGELDKLVRIGTNRLTNGDCEAEGGWQGEAVRFAPQGHESSRSLIVGPQLVGQEVSGFLGTHATWVLEFFYRGAEPGKRGDLLAGIMSQCDDPDSVAGRFHADDSWRFGRVTIKNGRGCQKLMVGLSAAGGEVLVDGVQLRQIRFPSVNHLLYEPLYDAKSVVLDNPLFAQKYDPLGNRREETPNRVLIPVMSTGVLNLVESAYLQNGRTGEVSSNWFIQPYSRESTELPISLGLRELRWISTVALYFNQNDPANTTPHFDIYAVDPETNEDKLVASVRHNAQIFRLVKFPPVRTGLVKVTLVNSIARLRTLTEIELYGPLSGREGTPSFVDAEGHNTYMGDFTRVDKRKKKLADAYLPQIDKPGSHEAEINFFAPMAEVLVSDNQFYLARTFGKTNAHSFKEPIKELYWSRTDWASLLMEHSTAACFFAAATTASSTV